MLKCLVWAVGPFVDVAFQPSTRMPHIGGVLQFVKEDPDANARYDFLERSLYAKSALEET